MFNIYGMDRLKMLEINRLLKELDYLESEQAYKNEIISEIDTEFIGSVNEFLKAHPELKQIFDNKMKSRVDESIRKKQEEQLRNEKEKRFTPRGEPMKKIFDEKQNEIVPKFDENGEYIEPTDENGNPIKVFDKKGRPIESKKDPSGKALPPLEEPEDTIVDENNEEHETEEQVEKRKEDEVKSKKIKKLYREIVKITHPDKVKSQKLNDLYIKATDFYDKNDLIAIYSVCNELKIEYELDDVDYELIKIKIKTIKEKMSFMESTFTWKWYTAADENEKQRVVLTYIKNQIR